MAHEAICLDLEPPDAAEIEAEIEAAEGEAEGEVAEAGAMEARAELLARCGAGAAHEP